MLLQPLIKRNKILSYRTFRKIYPALLSGYICCLLTNSRHSRSGPVSNRDAPAELLSRATCSPCSLGTSWTLGKLCLFPHCTWGNRREFFRSVLESVILEKNQRLPRVTEQWYIAWAAATGVIHRDVSFKIGLLGKALLKRATHLWNSLAIVGQQLVRFVNSPLNFYS